MKIILITTQTTHHTQFIKEIVKHYPVECAVIENKIVSADFSTHHQFEDQRQIYEKAVFFKGKRDKN